MSIFQFFPMVAGNWGHTQSACALHFSTTDPNFRFGPKMKAEGPRQDTRCWSVNSCSPEGWKFNGSRNSPPVTPRAATMSSGGSLSS